MPVPERAVIVLNTRSANQSHTLYERQYGRGTLERASTYADRFRSAPHCTPPMSQWTSAKREPDRNGGRSSSAVTCWCCCRGGEARPGHAVSGRLASRRVPGGGTPGCPAVVLGLAERRQTGHPEAMPVLLEVFEWTGRDHRVYPFWGRCMNGYGSAQAVCTHIRWFDF